MVVFLILYCQIFFCFFDACLILKVIYGNIARQFNCLLGGNMLSAAVPKFPAQTSPISPLKSACIPGLPDTVADIIINSLPDQFCLVSRKWNHKKVQRLQEEFCAFIQKISNTLQKYLPGELPIISPLVEKIDGNIHVLSETTSSSSSSADPSPQLSVQKLTQELQSLSICSSSSTSSSSQKSFRANASDSSQCISLYRAKNAFQSRTIVLAKKVTDVLLRSHIETTSCFVDVCGASGFQREISHLWNTGLSETSMHPGISLGLVLKASDVAWDWSEYDYADFLGITPVGLALHNSNPQHLKKMLHEKVGTIFFNNFIIDYDLQRYIELVLSQPQYADHCLEEGCKHLLHHGRIDDAITVTRVIPNKCSKLFQLHAILHAIVTRHDFKTLLKFLADDVISKCDCEGREELFSDAIASLFLLKRPKDAMEVAAKAPKTEGMAKILHDYAVGLFFVGRNEEAKTLTVLMQDGVVKMQTLLQISKNPTEVGKPFLGNDDTQKSDLLWIEQVCKSDQEDQILRQGIVQDKLDCVFDVCMKSMTSQSATIELCLGVYGFHLYSAGHILLSLNISKLFDAIRDILERYPAQDSASSSNVPTDFDSFRHIQDRYLAQDILLPLQRVVPLREDALKQALALSMAFGKRFYRTPVVPVFQEPYVGRLAMIGKLPEAIQILKEMFHEVEADGDLGRLFTHAITSSIKSGHTKEALSMIEEIPLQFRSRVVSGAINTLLLQKIKEEARSVFLKYLNILSPQSLEFFFFVFLILKDKEVIKQVMEMMAHDPKKYARTLQACILYCRSSGNLDLLPSRNDGIKDESFDEMKKEVFSEKAQKFDYSPKVYAPFFWETN
jgi:hypothetical protein